EPGRRAAGVRGVDARHGLPPARELVQHRQEGRARRASALHGEGGGARMTTTAAPRPDHLSPDPRPVAAVGPDAPGPPLPGDRHRGGLAPAAAGPRDLPASSDALAIAGLVPMSSCDWPGKLVATVFAQGCPW